MKKTLTLAYSSCPNDTFIFKAIANALIDLKGLSFEIAMEDVETLNQQAAVGTFDITKLSFAALGTLLDRYALLRTGAALGRGCGPLVISLPGRQLDRGKEKPVVAVPGMGTTALYLFRFYLSDLFPGLAPDIVPMPFEKIMPAVLDGSADFGVIIHEGRFVYQSINLEMKADLGQWWEDRTGLPIPLGCIAVRRDMDRDLSGRIQGLIRESIDHAITCPDQARAYIRNHAQELDDAVIQQHIDLYVNDFSRDLGKAGEEAVTAFFGRAVESGLMAPPSLPLFAC